MPQTKQRHGSSDQRQPRRGEQNSPSKEEGRPSEASNRPILRPQSGSRPRPDQRRPRGRERSDDAGTTRNSETQHSPGVVHPKPMPKPIPRKNRDNENQDGNSFPELIANNLDPKPILQKFDSALGRLVGACTQLHRHLRQRFRAHRQRLRFTRRRHGALRCHLSFTTPFDHLNVGEVIGEACRD